MTHHDPLESPQEEVYRYSEHTSCIKNLSKQV